MSRRSAALLIASAVLLGAGAAGTAAAAPADPAPLLLRLPDLGPGYVINKLDFRRSCTVMKVSSRASRLFFGPGVRRGCTLSFHRAWTPPGTSPEPTGVQAYAFSYDTPAGPATVLSHPRRLGAVMLGGRGVRSVEPAPPIGDQAVLFRVDRATLGIRFSVALVLWRSGAVLGIVQAVSFDGAGERNVQAAVRLAALQQAHIASPTPLRPPVNDDRFVALDDPTLSVPTLWLGEQLPAHGRFAELELRATDHPISFFGGPQPLVQMVYGPPFVTVELWRPRALRRALRRPLDRHRCQRRFDGKVDGAHSTIVATYRRQHRRCAHHDARYTAVAFFSGVGVTLDPGGRPDANPYDSRAGLRTLLRALQPYAPG